MKQEINSNWEKLSEHEKTIMNTYVRSIRLDRKISWLMVNKINAIHKKYPWLSIEDVPGTSSVKSVAQLEKEFESIPTSGEKVLYSLSSEFIKDREEYFARQSMIHGKSV